jgi:[lysine-biosynthesis-protein LysW]---L-2-aminoadipate ligase
MVEICLVYDKIRFEEKALNDKISQKGHKASLVDGKNLVFDTEFDLDTDQFGDIVLQRQVSHFRGLFVTFCLESYGINVVNSFRVSEICGNKLITSSILAKNKVPTPKTRFAFSSESAMEEMENFGYPIVIKPIVGSWGRGVYQIANRQMARMLVENREENQGMFSKIYYIQKEVKRPSRDIRCIVVGNRVIASVYRYSADKEWRTNVAIGGRTEEADLTKELEDTVLKAASAVGGGILGVDLMEDVKEGLVVHEINNTVEFRGAASVCKSDIPGSMADYLISLSKK